MTIPFALNPLGRLVAARDLPKYAEGPFRCAACRSPVILKQGEVRTWYFSHRPGSDCAKGFETALHLLAKQILLEHRHLRAPALVCVDESLLEEDITVCDEHIVSWDVAGEVEKWMGGIRPDFVADCGDQLLIVEVVVTHEPDDSKLAQLDSLAIPALEIDLSDVARDVTVDSLAYRMRSINDVLPMRVRRSEARCPRGHLHSDLNDRKTGSSKQTGSWPQARRPTRI
ncbi:competence protein CoiA family protein [Burkholderia sp. JSH-S8]|nr:competence protein CoiA family protein [Burkholderia sp. JSH-S8]